MKKIVVRVICYNQEEVISRALDSVLCQKEKGLYRLIVSDDSSTDGTWDILQGYKMKYPEVLEIYRNENNLGIYGNVAISEKYIPSDYDLFGELSGDDIYCQGYFEGVQKYIKDNKVDTREPVGIFSDWKSISPNNSETVHNQNAAVSGAYLFSLKLRGIICGRSLLVSKKVRDGYETMLKGQGLNLTESHWDDQAFLNIAKAYYIQQVSTAYYTGIGVSTRLTDRKSAYNTTEKIEKWNFYIKNYIHNECDLNYAKSEIGKALFFMKPTWTGLIKTLFYHQKGQLSGFKDSIVKGIRMILSLIKYKLTFKSH